MIETEINTSLEKCVSTIEDEIKQPITNKETVDIDESLIITDEYFNKMCDDIDIMNFIELKKLQRDLKSQYDTLEESKETIVQLMTLRETALSTTSDNPDLASAIIEADTEISTNIKDFEAFLNSYDDFKDKMERLIAKTDERINSFGDIKKTTSFLTNQMIDTLDKNIVRIKEYSSMGTELLTYHTSVREIFANRTSIDFIFDRIPTKNIEVRRLKSSIKKDKRDDTLKATQKRVTSSFSSCFNTKTLSIMEKYLIDLFGDEDIAFYFQYVLSLIYIREKTHGKYGKHKWVEILIMNIVDIATEVYDLDGGADYYNEQLLKLKEQLMKIL